MIKLHTVVAVLGLAVIAATPVHAATLDLNLNGDAVRGQLSGPLSKLFAESDGEYQAGVLYSEDRDDELTLLHGGVLLTGDAGMTEAKLTAGLGLRGQYTDYANAEGGGAAVGGQFDLRFAGFDRLGLIGYAWYQPKVLALGDFDDQFEWALAADYQILRNASLYLGYRRVTLNPEHFRTFTADSGAHFGLRLMF